MQHHRTSSRSFLKGLKQGPTWVVQAVPSEVQSGNGCVEEDEVSNGLGTFILSHLAPTHLQHLNLQKPACPKSATAHDYLSATQDYSSAATRDCFHWSHTVHLMSNHNVTNVNLCGEYDCFLKECL